MGGASPFAAVRALLQEVLPIEQGMQHQESIRQHVVATAERLEAQLGPEQFAYDGGCLRDIEASPVPAAPITVGLDGGYIRGRERPPGANGCFEVIAGKSIPEEGPSKVFAFVQGCHFRHLSADRSDVSTQLADCAFCPLIRARRSDQEPSEIAVGERAGVARLLLRQ